MSFVLFMGGVPYDTVYADYGSRPAVSLNSGTVITGGDGSEESPWVIE